MSSASASTSRMAMVAGHYLLLLTPFFLLLFTLPLLIEPSAVFGAGATFSPCPFRVVSSGDVVESASGGGGYGTRR
jgi:hypothetical protein